MVGRAAVPARPGGICALCIPGTEHQRPARLPYRRPAPLTTVLPFDESLPLSEPVHADAVDDAGRLLGLEGLVQLWGGRDRQGAVNLFPVPYDFPKSHPSR